MKPPPIDPRTTEQIADDLRAQLPQSWRPARDQLGSGRALIEIGARFAELVITRLNQAPERSYLEFLNLLGVEPAAPVPARTPLTFTLAKGAPAGTAVPKGTLVAAQPQDGGDAVVFETEEGIVTLPPLQGIVVSDGKTDRFEDRTEDASEGRQFQAFTATQPVPHELYLACSPEVIAAEASGLTVSFTIADDPHFWGEAAVRWSCWDGSAWHSLEASTPETEGIGDPGQYRVLIGLRALPKLERTTVHGIEAAWLRVAVDAQRLADRGRLAEVSLQQVRVGPTSGGRSRPLQHAVLNSAPLDVTFDFYPFGTQPAAGDCLYLAVPDELALPGAKLALIGELRTPPDKSLADPKITFETWNGASWEELDRPQKWDFKQKLEIELPTSLGRTAVGGTEGYWVRARLRGDYGKPATYEPVDKNDLSKGWKFVESLLAPVLASGGGRADGVGGAGEDRHRPAVTWQEDQKAAAAPVPAAVSHNDFAFRTEANADEKPIKPFSGGADPSASPALHVAFSAPLDGRLTAVFVVVDPPRPEELATEDADPPRPAVVWEYRTTTDWLPLTVVDDTDGLTRSGVFRFAAPMDIAELELFGRKGNWIRASQRSDEVRGEDRQEKSKQPQPRIRRLVPNTVWASQAQTTADELIGGGNGTAGQQLVAARPPILPGEQLMVNESDLGWQRWVGVPDFHGSEPQDRHYTVDRAGGVLRFGDGVAGRKLPAGQNNVRLTYRSGGGARGNQPAGAITELKSAVPYVDSATNPEPAEGGADAEPIGRIAELGPRMLRHNGRAVAAEDIEDLALAASTEVRRVKVVPPRDFDAVQLWSDDPAGPQTDENIDVGKYAVIVVPDSAAARPAPTLGLLNEVESALRSRCAVTAGLRVIGPEWIELTVEADVYTTDRELVRTLPATVVTALNQHLHALDGGPGGDGWGFGVLPRESDVYAVIQAVPGVDHVRIVKLGRRPMTDPGVVADALRRTLDKPPAPHEHVPNKVRSWIDRALVCPGEHRIKVPELRR